MLEIECITDKDGRKKAVVIPIDLWRKISPAKEASAEEISEEVESYCLNKAMDEAETGWIPASAGMTVRRQS